MAFRARPTVLIAEDNPLIAVSYEDIVTDAGLSVGGAFLSCESAEKWLSVHNPENGISRRKLCRHPSALTCMF